MLEETNASESVAEEILEEIDDTDVLDSEKINTENIDESKVDTKIMECGDYINTQLVPIKKIKCIVPIKLLEIIRKIECCVKQKFKSDNEFSIYIHGDWDDNGNLVVSENFYIPRQKVSFASVDYIEEPEDYYNGCLHKHPDGCKNFSGTDEKYINSNFDFSLLYVCLKISKGIVNIIYDGKHRIQCNVDIEIDNCGNIEGIDIDNIIQEEKKTTIYNSPTPSLLLPGFNSCYDPKKTRNEEIILPHVAQPNLGGFMDEDSIEMDNPEIIIPENDLDEPNPEFDAQNLHKLGL